MKISHFVQRWENALAVTWYQHLNFVKKWTWHLCAVNRYVCLSNDVSLHLPLRTSTVWWLYLWRYVLVQEHWCFMSGYNSFWVVIVVICHCTISIFIIYHITLFFKLLTAAKVYNGCVCVCVHCMPVSVVSCVEISTNLSKMRHAVLQLTVNYMTVAVLAFLCVAVYFRDIV